MSISSSTTEPPTTDATALPRGSTSHPMGTEIERLLRRKRPPTHPGELLQDELEELGMSVTAAARHLNISRGHLHRVLSGKSPVSGEVAVRLGRMFGNGPGLWARMQLAYDLWHAERAVPLGEVEQVHGQKPVDAGA